MSKERIESYKQFADNIKYPMLIFEAESGKVLCMNYEAELVFGRQVERVELQPGRILVKDDFWTMLHSKKGIMWHRLRLVADGNEHAVSGFVNEMELDGVLIYTVLFEAQMRMGSFVLERVLSQAGIVSIYVTKQDEDYRVEYVSKNINVYGYTREELYNNKVALRDIVCEQDWSRVRDSVKDIIAKREEDLVLECRIFTETKELMAVRTHVHCLYNEYGNFSALELLIFDLRGELYHRRANDYLNQAIDKMKSVVLVKTYKPGERKLTYISPNAGMVGMNVEALSKGYKLTEDYIHPEDRNQVIDMIYRAIASGVTDYVHTYRMVRDDGKQIWVLNELTVSRMEENEAQISFLLTDITEQKMMEEELAAAREELPGEESLKEEDKAARFAADLSGKGLIEQLQEMTEMLDGHTKCYNVILDLEGHLLTNPVGPMKDRGQFYDLFERPQFKEQFVEAAGRAKEQVIPVSTTFSIDAMEVHMVFAPIIIKDAVEAYWVLTDFGSDELTILGDMAGRQWRLVNLIARSFYADEMARQESQRRRLLEIQLEKEQQGRRLIKEFIEAIVKKGGSALDEICQKTAFYMDIANIGIYIKNKGSKNVEKYYTWNHTGEQLEFFDRMKMSASEYQDFQKQIGEEKVLVVDGNTQKQYAVGSGLPAGNEAMMIATMPARDGTKGYIVFANIRGKHQFEERDKEFAQTLASLLSGMLLDRNKSHHGHGIQKESFLEAYEHVREAVFMKDNRSGDIIYANKAMGKLFGYDVVGMPAKNIVYDEMEHYKNMGAVRKQLIANKKVTKWQSYMKELDQIMNIVEIPMDVFGGDYSLMILKKSKNKK